MLFPREQIFMFSPEPLINYMPDLKLGLLVAWFPWPITFQLCAVSCRHSLNQGKWKKRENWMSILENSVVMLQGNMVLPGLKRRWICSVTMAEIQEFHCYL